MSAVKPKIILQLKSSLGADAISAMSDADAKNAVQQMRDDRAKDGNLQISFSGFNASKKKRLANAARKNQFKVAVSVTKELDFLVVGNSISTRDKLIEKAAEQGVQLLSEKQYNSMIESGVTVSLV